MIRVSDIVPHLPPPLPGGPVRPSVVDASPASWLEGVSARSDVRISADPDTRSRGLSVSQHAEQVLAHLCAASDERP